MTTPKFWIRKDREQYFLGGVIIACSIGAFVSSYWHFCDRISVKQRIKIQERLKPAEVNTKLKEVQYTPVRLKVGTTQYYKMDDNELPAVPKLGEDQ